MKFQTINGWTKETMSNGSPVGENIPEWLARVKDRLFKGMPENDAMAWRERFFSAIPVGADLEQVKAPFLIYVLECALEKFDHNAYPDCKEAIATVIELYRRGETDVEKFRQAAVNAANAAVRAARSAVWAAMSAEAAAEAVWSAAWATRSVETAAEAAAWVDAASSAAEYTRFADKLIELMSALDA